MAEWAVVDSLIMAVLDGTASPDDLLALRGVASGEMFAAAAVADAAAVATLVEADSEVATLPGGPRNWPPLLYVCFSKLRGDEAAAACAQVLLSQGADPDAHFFDPAYPDAPQSALYGAVGVNNNPLLADVLLRHGANTQDGESIYHAAQLGHFECLEVLKKHGADFSAVQQPWNNTPLYFLLGHRQADAQWAVALSGVRWLLEEGGADPNVTSSDYEETPLHLAARRHGADVIELLLAHGAQFDQPTRDGLTPCALAARHGNMQAIETLRRHGADLPLSPVDQLLATCAVGDEAHAAALVQDDPELMLKLGPRDLALLCEHAAEGNLDAVSAMCALGFPTDVMGEQKSTALHQAAWYGQVDVAEVLLEYCAPLDVKDEVYQGTPLDWVCHGSQFCKQQPQETYAELAQMLIRYGAPLPAEDWGSDEVRAALRKARHS